VSSLAVAELILLVCYTVAAVLVRVVLLAIWGYGRPSVIREAGCDPRRKDRQLGGLFSLPVSEPAGLCCVMIV